jgi:glyoxylase-like metal-dependent hydrolase (beta-lactamase superfamily II)
VISSNPSTEVRGLVASPPAGLSFTTALQIHAFRLQRADGDLIVYAAGGWRGTDASAQRQFLGHWHEAAEGGPATGAAVWVHEADADEVRTRLAVSATFDAPFKLGEDFEVWPMPGHTPGSTAFLWVTGEDRVLFTADSIYPREDGVWRAAVLDTSDRAAMADSIQRLAALEFTVLAPWVMPAAAQPLVRVAPRDGQQRMLQAAARVRAGGN